MPAPQLDGLARNDGAPVYLLRAGVECPACAHRFAAQWHDREPATQQCPECGEAFGASWPGWNFRPREVAKKLPFQRPGESG